MRLLTLLVVAGALATGCDLRASDNEDALESGGDRSESDAGTGHGDDAGEPPPCGDGGQVEDGGSGGSPDADVDDADGGGWEFPDAGGDLDGGGWEFPDAG